MAKKIWTECHRQACQKKGHRHTPIRLSEAGIQVTNKFRGV